MKFVESDSSNQHIDVKSFVDVLKKNNIQGDKIFFKKLFGGEKFNLLKFKQILNSEDEL